MGPVLWVETQRKREITGTDAYPGERVVRATVWVIQSQGVMWGKMSPSAGWRTAGTNMRTVGSLDTTWEEQAGASPPYNAGKRDVSSRRC